MSWLQNEEKRVFFGTSFPCVDERENTLASLGPMTSED